jgi:tetratricopeptide (TPR) repeat protein
MACAHNRIVTALVLVATLGAALPAAASDPLQALQAEMSQAETLLKQGDHAGAGRKYRSILTSAWVELAAIARAEGHPRASAQALQHARWVSGAATPADGTENLAALAATKRRSLERRTREMAARAAYNLGVLAAQEKEFADAGAFFDLAREAQPSFPRVDYSAGVAYFNAQRFDQAKTSLERAVDLDAKDVEAQRMLALTEFNLEHYGRAAALLEDDPRRAEQPALQYTYGVALVRSNQADKASEVFSALLASHANSPEVNVVLGLAHAEQGDFDAAVTSLERARQLDPAVPEAAAALGMIRLRQGQLDVAEPLLREAVTRHPEDRRAAEALGELVSLLGRNDEAITELRRIVAAAPDRPKAQYLLGKVLLSTEHVSEAIPPLEAAVRLAPEDAASRFQLAQAYRRSGDAAKAQEQLEAYQALKERRRAIRP